MVHHETLHTVTALGHYSDSIHRNLHVFLTDCVIPSSVVIRCVFFSGNHLLCVEQITIAPSSDLINHCRLQIDEYTPREVTGRRRLQEQR